MSFLRSLQAKVLLAALIPGSVILIIVAVIALFQYGATVLEIVEERDSKLAMLTAHQLSDGLVRHTRILETVASEGAFRYWTRSRPVCQSLRHEASFANSTEE